MCQRVSTLKCSKPVVNNKRKERNFIPRITCNFIWITWNSFIAAAPFNPNQACKPWPWPWRVNLFMWLCADVNGTETWFTAFTDVLQCLLNKNQEHTNLWRFSFDWERNDACRCNIKLHINNFIKEFSFYMVLPKSVFTWYRFEFRTGISSLRFLHSSSCNSAFKYTVSGTKTK